MLICDTFVGFKRYFLLACGNRPKSYLAVLNSLNRFIGIANIQHIEDCTTVRLESYLIQQSESCCWSPKTYRNQWQNLKSYFNWCVRQELLKVNPLVNVARPKLNKPLPRSIGREEVKSVLFHAELYPWRYTLERSRNVALISTLLFAGLRLQELLDLHTADIDLKARQILVRNGKGGKQRKVPIHCQLCFKLEEYMSAKKERHNGTEFMFTSVKSGMPLTQKNVLAVCKKIREKSSVYFTPHMLRHTFGRLCVEAGIHLFSIKEMMGHEHISTTQRYLSISTETIQNQFDKVSLI